MAERETEGGSSEQADAVQSQQGGESQQNGQGSTVDLTHIETRGQPPGERKGR